MHHLTRLLSLPWSNTIVVDLAEALSRMTASRPAPVSILTVVVLLIAGCNSTKNAPSTKESSRKENVLPISIAVGTLALDMQILKVNIPEECHRTIALGINNIGGNFAYRGNIDDYLERKSEGTEDCPYNVAVQVIGRPADPRKCFDVAYYMLPVEIGQMLDRFGRPIGPKITRPIFNAERIRGTLWVCRAGAALNAWRITPKEAL